MIACAIIAPEFVDDELAGLAVIVDISFICCKNDIV